MHQIQYRKEWLGVLTMTNKSRIKIDCTLFFELIDEIESGEANTSVNWNLINKEARFAERVKAYEKMFYHFLDGGMVLHDSQNKEFYQKFRKITHNG